MRMNVQFKLNARGAYTKVITTRNRKSLPFPLIPDRISLSERKWGNLFERYRQSQGQCQNHQFFVCTNHITSRVDWFNNCIPVSILPQEPFKVNLLEPSKIWKLKLGQSNVLNACGAGWCAKMCSGLLFEHSGSIDGWFFAAKVAKGREERTSLKAG